MPTRRIFLHGLVAAPLPLFSGALKARAQAASGRFTGASGHATTGTGGIVAQDGVNYVSLAEDFRFDGAPDPKVALGRNGYDPATLLGPLKSDTGAQSYRIPDSIDPAAYNEIWIWCEQFNVPLGSAKLNR